MPSYPCIPAHLDQLRRDAKRLVQQQKVKYSVALDVLARKFGYSNWSLLHKAVCLPQMESLRLWFESNHIALSNGYKYPEIDVFSSLMYNFPGVDKKLIQQVACRLDSKHAWTSDLIIDVVNSAASPRRKTRISSRYNTCKILSVEDRSSYVNIVVPVVRCVDRYAIANVYYGELYFRCPICGKVHWHGAVGEEFGAGNGDRLPHCSDIKERSSFHFELVEVRDRTLPGHIPQRYLKDIAIPV